MVVVSDTATLTGAHTIVLREPDGTLTTLNDEFRDVQLDLSHTQSSQWDVTIPYRPGLEAVVGPSTEVYIFAEQRDGSYDLLFRGNAPSIDTDASLETGTTTLSGWDTSYLLRQDAAEVTYQNIRAGDAIQDYWDTYTPFNATVTRQDPSLIVEDETAYSLTTTSDFQGRLDVTESTPVIASGDSLSVTQTCFTTEAEDYTAGLASLGTFSGYSGGDNGGIVFTDNYVPPGPNTSESGDYAEYQFNVDHVIPGSAFELFVRGELASGGVGNEISITVNGESVGRYESSNTALEWKDNDNILAYSAPSDLRPENNPQVVRFEQTAVNDDSVSLDVVAPADGRYSYTLDNTLNANGYLDGPELYPDAVDVDFTTFEQTYNLTAVDIASTWSDTTGSQALAASNDGRSTYVSASNTSTLDESFSTVGTTLDVRLTFSRYGSRSTTTPLTGYLGQSVDDITVKYSADDLSVFDSITVDRSDFRNLQNLHTTSDFLFSMDYREDELRVDSFPQGAVTESLDVIVTYHRRRLDTRDYYNDVVVRGAPDSSGNRLTVSPDAPQSELDKYGSVTRVFIKDNLETKADLESFARTKLREGLRGDDLRGNLSIFPKYVRPGFDYPVSELGGVEATLESVSYSMGAGGSLGGSLVFVDEPGVVPQVASLRGELGDVSDAN